MKEKVYKVYKQYFHPLYDEAPQLGLYAGYSDLTKAYRKAEELSKLSIDGKVLSFCNTVVLALPHFCSVFKDGKEQSCAAIFAKV